MNHTSRDVGNLAPGHAIEHGGRTYRFRFIDDVMEATFERRRFDAARQALRANKSAIVEDLGEDGYRARLGKLYEALDRHEFSIHHIGRQDDPGAIGLLLQLMLDVDADTLQAIRAGQNEEVMRLFLLVYRASFGTDQMEAQVNRNPTSARPSRNVAS